MSSSQSTEFEHNRRQMENELKSKQESLEGLRKYIRPKDDEIICVLKVKKSEKEEELKNCYWFQYFAKSNLVYEIWKLRMRIDQLTSVKTLEREVEKIKQRIHEIPGNAWGEYPGTLDNKTVVDYRNKFETLTNPLTPEVPFINIIMIGETGSGKSSFLKTFATALTKTTEDRYGVFSNRNSQASSTKRIHLEPFYIGEEGLQLPCRFFDMPGIDRNETIKIEDLEKILNGEFKLKIELKRESEFERQSHNPADLVHCILYVISAKTNLENLPHFIKIMQKNINDNKTEDGVKQFAVVTFIDKLGMPNDDMKHAYQYPCVREYCEELSLVLGLDLLHVIPVSNYFEEDVQNDAKNAMSLFNLWRVFNSAKGCIERRWKKKETRFFTKNWSSIQE